MGYISYGQSPAGEISYGTCCGRCQRVVTGQIIKPRSAIQHLFVLLDIQTMNLTATPLHAANPECDFVATLSNVFETPANGRLFHTKPHGTRLNYYVALCVHS